MDEADSLRELVGIYSPSGAEGKAVRRFRQLADRLGYRTREDAAGNGIARRGVGRPRVMFLGHIDTVPGARPARRTRARIHGRGAVDAKAALVAALHAGAGFTGPGTLEIVAAVGEETDSRGARVLARRDAPDALIGGEPNGWDGVGIGYKGCVRLEASFEEPRRHAASPYATSADGAVRWANRLVAEGSNPPDGSLFRTRTIKVLGVRSPIGRREATVVTVEARLPPGDTPRNLLRDVARVPGSSSVRTLVAIEPWEATSDSPVVAALIEAIRAEGARPTLWRKSGTSDVNVVGPSWRCPAAVYGPGNPRLDHTDRESISIEELRRSVRVLRRAFARLAGSGAVSAASIRAPLRPSAEAAA